MSVAPAAEPRSRRSAWWAWRSSSSVIWCRSCGQGGQVGVGLGGREGPQPEVGDLVQQLGDGGDRGRDRVLSGVVECRCHTGNSGIDHRHSRSGNAGIPGSCGEVFRPFLEPSMSWVSTGSRHQGVVGSADPARQPATRESAATTCRTPPRRCAFHHPPASSREGGSLDALAISTSGYRPPGSCTVAAKAAALDDVTTSSSRSGDPSGPESGTRQLGCSSTVPGWFWVRRSPTASVSATQRSRDGVRAR